MRRSGSWKGLLAAVMMVGLTPGTRAQTPAAAPALETQTEMMGKLSAEQKTRFDAAAKLFGSSDYAGALKSLRTLVGEMPGDAVLAKYAAEAAINVREYPYAVQMVTGVLTANPEDWQAHTLRARAAAETGDGPVRDAEIARIEELRAKGIVPQNLRQYPIERVKVGEKSLLIFQSLFPWGNFKVQNYAQVFDASGKVEMRITLENADFDQPGFAKEHAEAAARGDRRYSYDGYRDNGVNAQGQHSETHLSFGFVDKRPTLDEVRERFTSIAKGGGAPLSSNTHAIP